MEPHLVERITIQIHNADPFPAQEESALAHKFLLLQNTHSIFVSLLNMNISALFLH